MASTNKTTHYNLSQYIGTDKPTYLVDYNTDMSNIDAGIYGAKAEADANSGAIGNLSNLETTDKSSLVGAVNEVKGETDKIGNLSNLTTEAQSNLVGAINEVDAESDLNNQNIGTMVNLETTVKTSLVGAINEVNANSGDLSNLTTTTKTNLVGAINEVNTKTDIFSTTEVKTDKTWNGKPIYRKIFTVINLPDTTSYPYNLLLTNPDLVKINYGDSFMTWGLPRTYGIEKANPTITFNIDENKNLLITTVDNSYVSWTAYVVIEYTKTTD